MFKIFQTQALFRVVGGGSNLAKSLAFTLAETLITLVIIGIVAALTVPTLMVNHQKEQTVTQIKKVYSDFCGALNMSEALNGPRSTWDYENYSSKFFSQYLTPFISIQKVKKGKVDEEIIYREASGKEEESLNQLKDSAYITTLISGAQVFSSTTGNQSLTFKCYIVDANGNKKPNKFGRDLFFICIDKERGVTPFYWDDNKDATHKKTRDQLKSGPSNHRYQCNKNSRGMWCLALIMADGWQIKDDYPW